MFSDHHLTAHQFMEDGISPSSTEGTEDLKLQGQACIGGAIHSHMIQTSYTIFTDMEKNY